MKTFLIILCAALIEISDQRSTRQDDSYVAAVVEFQVAREDTQQNINSYVLLIQQAASQNADIVVFPEMTLMTRENSAEVPINGLLEQYPVPALRPDLYDQTLVSLSAAAQQNQIYVVVNIREFMNCSNAPGEYCPEEKVYYFNTNVVFNRTGAIIDRYRKINLFGELSHTPALRPDLGIFTTDFGVTFGHFICFDLMFQVPAVQVVEKYNLTDVIFPTMWFSEMPYLTAVEIQESYAYTLNVNFLASGANNVAAGSTGSGIYSGKVGALVSIMSGVPTTRLLVSRVPKVPGQVTEKYPGPIYDKPTDHDGLNLISDPSIPSHVTKILVPGSQEFVLVDKEVSCRFKVHLNQRQGETVRYFAAAKDGTNTYSRRQIGIATCLLVACKSDDIKSCVYRFNNETDVELQELQIEMNTYEKQYNSSLKCDNIVYYPLSLRSSKFPLSPTNFTYSYSKHSSLGHVPLQNRLSSNDKPIRYVARDKIHYKLNLPQKDLVAFGIWGRIYTKDVDHNKATTGEDLDTFNDIFEGIYRVKSDDY